jgi:peptide/nickel transport system substrate-binding protein
MNHVGRTLTFFLLASTLALAQYQEAPVLQERVAAGELPPVADRLPENPLVLTPLEAIGTYGGTWNLVQESDFPWWGSHLLYEDLAMWNPDQSAFVPELAESWSYNDDSTQLTLNLREGLKWSDGMPMTADDYIFWWEEVVLGTDLDGNPSPWSWFQQPWTKAGEQPMQLEKVDDFTILHTFAAPNPNAHYWWETGPVFQRVWPTHFLKQFHPQYNDAANGWEDLQNAVNFHGFGKPDMPVLTPWKTAEYLPDQRIVLERNPYFWKVDTDGNQLPYIDRIVIDYVGTMENVKLRILNGEVDFQIRPEMTGADYPLLFEGQEQGNYEVRLFHTGRGAQPALYPNLNHPDANLQAFFRDQRVRIALSIGIDRALINDVIYNGLLQPFQGTIGADSWHFKVGDGPALLEEWQQAYAEYDPERANQLLDEAGYVRGQDGSRIFPDGSKISFVATINTADQGTKNYVDAMQMVKEAWAELGIEVILDDVSQEEYDQTIDAGTFDMYVYESSDHNAFTWPAQLIPVVHRRSWPMVTMWYQTNGEQGSGPEAYPGDVEERLLAIWEKIQTETDELARHKLVHDAIRIHIDEGPFFIGVVGEPTIPGVIHRGFRNVGNDAITGPWWANSPRNMYPEQFFIEGGQ